MSVEPVHRNTEYVHMLILRKLREIVIDQKFANASAGAAGCQCSSMDNVEVLVSDWPSGGSSDNTGMVTADNMT